MNTERRHQLMRLACAGVVVVTPLLAVVSSSSGSAPTAPGLVAQAIHDADQAGWVHEVQTCYQRVPSGKTTMTVVDDIGATMSRQVATFGNGGHDTLVAFDSKHRLYEIANAKGLLDFQITSNVGQYANKWMQETPSDPGYTFDAFATTLSTDFHQYTPLGHLRLGPVVLMHGERVRAITGDAPRMWSQLAPTAKATMYVSASGPVLPVSFTVAIPQFPLRVTWSHWGRPVKLVAPASFIAHPVSSATATA